MQKTHALISFLILKNPENQTRFTLMKRPQFSLSSDQLELLLAFEDSKGLNALAESMGRDPSVVSRGLQKIAEEYPVLVKVKGRWELTPLGRQINELTRSSIKNYQDLLPKAAQGNQAKKYLSSKSVLIIINAQAGLLDATQLGRNNSDAETNIEKLLAHWRKNKKTVLHVKHISENPNSIFYRNASGSNFLPEFEPAKNEDVLEKTKSSAFLETDLENKLKALEPENIILVGFTANECIDATAKDAAHLGFPTYVVGDATAMFDMHTPEGKLIKAERLHKLTLANINALHAPVINTADITP
jgi:nicotinamidase-related amidase